MYTEQANIYSYVGCLERKLIHKASWPRTVGDDPMLGCSIKMQRHSTELDISISVRPDVLAPASPRKPTHTFTERRSNVCEDGVKPIKRYNILALTAEGTSWREAIIRPYVQDIQQAQAATAKASAKATTPASSHIIRIGNIFSSATRGNKAKQPPQHAPPAPIKAVQLPQHAPPAPIKAVQLPQHAPPAPIKAVQLPQHAPPAPIKAVQLPQHAPPAPIKAVQLPQELPRFNPPCHAAPKQQLGRDVTILASRLASALRTALSRSPATKAPLKGQPAVPVVKAVVLAGVV